MAGDQEKIQSLRDAWETAVGKDRPKDALWALEGLELLEPDEARWPHRKGDVLRRLGRTKEAEESFARAVRCYVAQGFLTRAAALAKAIVGLNPARTDILDELEQGPVKKLRDGVQAPGASSLAPRVPPPPRLPSGTMPAARAPAATPPARADPIPREEPVEFPKTRAVLAAPPRPPPKQANSHEEHEENQENERPSFVAGVRVDRISVVAAAMGLESAKDASDDEVRFEDVPDVFAIDVDLSELEEEPTRDSTPELEVDGFGEEEEAPTALRLALMSAVTLFVGVSKEAMAEMVSAAHLIDLPHGARVYGSGEPAEGVYVVVEGRVDVVVAGTNRKVVVGEGSVFGEDALLQGAVRNGSTRVSGRLLALKIPKEALDRIVLRHPSLGDVLFDVLVRRLVTMALQTSPLFGAFDVPTRKELSRLFEVRRASAGIVIKQRGKRSDGLYLALAGELEADDGTTKTSIPLGTMFGHTSILSDAPQRRTIRTRRESVVLRLPAARFLAFAARFPAALAHLARLAKEPQAL